MPWGEDFGKESKGKWSLFALKLEGSRTNSDVLKIRDRKTVISSDGCVGQNTRGCVSDGRTTPSCRVPDGDHGFQGGKEANS